MKTKLIVLALSLTVGTATAAHAQGRSHLGPHIGYNFDWEALVLGAQYTAPIGQHLELYPSFDYLFIDAGTLFGLNMDLKYRLPIQGADWLYLGGGLNVSRLSFGNNSSTDAAVNLIAGLESRAGNVHPFGEFRLTAGSGSTIQLVAGLNFTLGRHQ